jgi:hypothetical protein
LSKRLFAHVSDEHKQNKLAIGDALTECKAILAFPLRQLLNATDQSVPAAEPAEKESSSTQLKCREKMN